MQGPIGNPTTIFLAVDYEQAPVPQNFYVADYFQVEEQDLTVLLTFGKRDSVEAALRTKVEIVFPSLLFAAQLWKSSRDFHKTLTKFVAAVGSSALKPGEALRLLGDKVHTAQANNVFMVLSGSECLMDFYYISPKDMWTKPKRGEELNLEPVVRVITPPNLLLGFLDVCDPIGARLSERFAAHIKELPHDNLEPA